VTNIVEYSVKKSYFVDQFFSQFPTKNSTKCKQIDDCFNNSLPETKKIWLDALVKNIVYQHSKGNPYAYKKSMKALNLMAARVPKWKPPLSYIKKLKKINYYNINDVARDVAVLESMYMSRSMKKKVKKHVAKKARL